MSVIVAIPTLVGRAVLATSAAGLIALGVSAGGYFQYDPAITAAGETAIVAGGGYWGG